MNSRDEDIAEIHAAVARVANAQLITLNYLTALHATQKAQLGLVQILLRSLGHSDEKIESAINFYFKTSHELAQEQLRAELLRKEIAVPIAGDDPWWDTA